MINEDMFIEGNTSSHFFGKFAKLSNGMMFLFIKCFDLVGVVMAYMNTCVMY